MYVMPPGITTLFSFLSSKARVPMCFTGKPSISEGITTSLSI